MCVARLTRAEALRPRTCQRDERICWVKADDLEVLAADLDQIG